MDREDIERIRLALEKPKSADGPNTSAAAANFVRVAPAAALVGWSLGGATGAALPSPSRTPRWAPGLSRFRPPLGLRPPALRSGLRQGLAAADAGAARRRRGDAVPQVRAAMADRERPDASVRWLLLGIPLGTVWAEEAPFRGMLGTLAERRSGRGRGCCSRRRSGSGTSSTRALTGDR